MDISEAVALHATYVAGAVSAGILFLRLCVSYRTIDTFFWITLFALPVVLARTLIRHFSLSYGTASDAVHELELNPSYQPDLARIHTGTVLTIAGRILLTTHLWTMCLLLLLTYRRFIWHFPWMQHVIRVMYVTMAATWLATTTLNLFECVPFSKYSEVSLHPPTCQRAYKQTLMICLSNIVLDLAIIAMCHPILLLQHATPLRRLRLGALIGLGAICVLASALRIAYIFKTGSMQPARDLWAAVTVGLSTIVANAPYFYGLIAKKNTSRNESTVVGAEERRLTVRPERKSEMLADPDLEGGTLVDLEKKESMTVDVNTIAGSSASSARSDRL
ncbi:hypothetical protein BDZ85DRAFT_279949 [Elsinoe ampelina]|uniref:Rhodopsin domain-containing protein n=1 Tax=Elsinoe ampelina TaxID=302913 RepID=A0A6A6GGC4_9PEZI|nr:hypothetical protein BDZ85DRAFT_279949 [Elsinoe ampelina]